MYSPSVGEEALTHYKFLSSKEKLLLFSLKLLLPLVDLRLGPALKRTDLF